MIVLVGMCVGVCVGVICGNLVFPVTPMDFCNCQADWVFNLSPVSDNTKRVAPLFSG